MKLSIDISSKSSKIRYTIKEGKAENERNSAGGYRELTDGESQRRRRFSSLGSLRDDKSLTPPALQAGKAKNRTGSIVRKSQRAAGW